MGCLTRVFRQRQLLPVLLGFGSAVEYGPHHCVSGRNSEIYPSLDVLLRFSRSNRRYQAGNR